MAGQLPKLAVVALGGAGGDLAYAVASGGALSVVSAASSLYLLATIALGSRCRASRAADCGGRRACGSSSAIWE